MIRIVDEATQFEANGRGAMIDNIALRETLPINTGFEDGVIRLSAIHAALADTDGSEILSVFINALPVGATLSDVVRTFTATTGHTSADITDWDMTTLTLIPPTNFNGTLNLGVVATATESATGDTVSTTATLVLPVNDTPVASNASYWVQQDGSVRIDFSYLLGDVDDDLLNLSFIQPVHGTLTRNSDGSYTYMPAAGYTGLDAFNYIVFDGSLAVTATITINVIAGVPETTSSIDWTGSTPVNGFSNISLPPNQVWITDFLGATEEQRSLAQQTGLVVTGNP